jgi:hypothetical protein
MIRSMSVLEIAAAMGKSETEFREILPALIILGFPDPSKSNGSFVTAEVLNWVVNDQEQNLSIISRLAARLNDMA